MVARVSTYEGSPGREQEVTQAFERSTQAVQELDGFAGSYLLFDSSTGRAMTVALWSTPEAADASDKRVAHLREEAASDVGHQVTGTEVYDVVARMEV
ncbi:MAG TPA: hypothetical protein VF520_02240 [Thermoleophilaceae bacterium]|jgi:heme-degrading monooxygenase HmoA